MALSMSCPPLLAAADDVRADASRAPTDVAQALCSQAPRLRRLVHRLLGWRAAADELDDVVQDVLLKAWNGRASFRGEASLATWLTAIALSTTASHARARARWRRLFGWFDREPAQPLPSTDNDASQRAAAAMQRLRHDDREVLVLRYLEQRAIPEIAELLGCTRPAVDARLSRARQRLRDLLGGTEEP